MPLYLKVFPFYAVRMFRRTLLLLLFCLSMGIGSGGVVSADPSLRVLVLDNAPPMSFRDPSGQFSGFSVEIALAVCAEMHAHCVLEVVRQNELIERLAQGRADFAATGLLETPERRGKLLFTMPCYRSFSLWVAKAGVKPGQVGVKVAAVNGSAQAEYARTQGWSMHLVATNGDLGGVMLSGEVQALLVPMTSALSLQADDAFRKLDLASTVVRAAALEGGAAFGVSPLRPELVGEINAALVRIKRNGTYDRINSRYLPFRVS